MQYQKKDLEKFPYQIDYSIKNYFHNQLKIENFNNIVLCGLGGSGIANQIVKCYFYNHSHVPIEVVSDYHLPKYVNEKSLVILNSYSGNTEETLSSFHDAINRKAQLLVMSTGGKLVELAQSYNVPAYYAEKGFQPRMALGYSLTYLIQILSELLNLDLTGELIEVADKLKDSNHYLEKAQKLFEQIQPQINSKFIVVCDMYTTGIALRFSQQLNENAKAESFVNQLPEANHNVIETYNNKLDSVFIFMNSLRHKRVNFRFEFLHDLLREHNQTVVHYRLNNYNLSDIYETIYIFDWLSLIVANARNVKSNEIPNILRLKEYLSQK